MKKIIIGLLLLTCFINLNSCKKKINGCTDSAAINFNSDASEDDGTCTYLTIGQSYQGGIVAYILQSGDPGYIAGETHGIIAAPNDQGTGIQWYNGIYTVTGATASALGTGNDNTATIVASQGAGNYAAKICSDLVLGGHSDWYLPSNDELVKLYLNKTAIGGFVDNDVYWSSTEEDINRAWYKGFGGGNNIFTDKAATMYVRAVRSF